MTLKAIGKYKSSNYISDITYYIYATIDTPKAIVQISHGMCEYTERYENFISFLNEHNILVCGNDHLGHKDSAISNTELGFFSKKDGYTHLVKDIYKLTTIMKNKYPNVPYFLFGHSMGSFVSRLYISEHSDKLSGVILCGTGDKNPLAGAGIILSSIISKICGNHYRSKLLKSLSFFGYNKQFPEGKYDKNSWLTSDSNIRDSYNKDKHCNFIFTASAYHDLSLLIKNATSDRWFATVDKDLPIYITSGALDPVGNYSVGVMSVYEKLKAQNIDDLEMKLYENGRHEIINEVFFDTVYQDILNWILERI